MKQTLDKTQRQKLRDLGVKGGLYETSSIGMLISLLPSEIENYDHTKTYYLTIRKTENKWMVQYMDFYNNTALIGHAWYATELIMALYKAAKDLLISEKYYRKVYNIENSKK